MFNRQPFNRGKFNVSSIQTTGASGLAQMSLSTPLVSASKIISAGGISNLSLKSLSEATINKYSPASTAAMTMGYTANGTKAFIVACDDANMVLGASASQTLSGEQVIKLDNLVLKPGEELIINTCDMTVTLNGQNAMQYFSSDSDFISLLNGLNTLIYSDSNASRKAMFDVIWKDRWL
ncbi:Phage tail protein [Acetoanaerobium noterae]|uniref:Phage tail protein n=1 Tax=Acetoanaerobium noterae TaxID=745369 RepID=A0A1T5ANL7_9FIRM|nr:phage tail domain-containing protein [Acetoanaerobium noterae]SKB36203.1 Phage tail protein [Acetoanaerobium noterae]